MTTSSGVEVHGVSRSFGDFVALRSIDLTVPAGQVTALVGPNGAGKTTLLLILATLLTPDHGTITIDGVDVLDDPRAARSKIGWSPDVFGLYDNLEVSEYLRVFAHAYALPKAGIEERVTELLALGRLSEFAQRPVHVLSRGQKQRLNLLRALIHKPSVLLLDEPASGLDPRSRIELRDLLRTLAADGTAVLVSSHILSDLEEVADRVVFVDGGATVGEDQLSALQVNRDRTWRFRALDNAALQEALAALEVTTATVGTGVDVKVASEEAAADLITQLIERGVRLTAAAPVGGNLEAAYLSLTEGTR